MNAIAPGPFRTNIGGDAPPIPDGGVERDRGDRAHGRAGRAQGRGAAARLAGLELHHRRGRAGGRRPAADVARGRACGRSSHARSARWSWSTCRSRARRARARSSCGRRPSASAARTSTSSSASSARGRVQFPRIQGHEVAATVESVGPECEERARAPATASLCTRSATAATATRAGSGATNVCDNFSLIGIHEDGGFQELLRMPEELVFPTGERRPAVAALASRCRSPSARSTGRSSRRASTSWSSAPGRSARRSACSRRARRARADDRSVQSRLELGTRMGAETLAWSDSDEVDRIRPRVVGREGAEVVFDATGAPTRSGPGSRPRSRPGGS